MSKIIVVNRGSASKKYALFEEDGLLMDFHFEESTGGFVLHQKKDNSFNKDMKITKDDYDNAFDLCINLLIKDSYINYVDDVDAVVFRIVAPGKYFTHDRVIDQSFLEKLDEIREQAPLHIDKIHEEFNKVMDKMHDVKLIAISDSRFHNTMPDFAKIYSLPSDLAKKYEIYRYGYHGISVSSIKEEIIKNKKEFPEKVVVCHLGGGSSITALRNGESIDTTMGYSPLEGLTMATRIGNIDAGALISLADKADLEMSEIRDMFYNECGILGISKKTNDIRDLIDLSESGDKDSTLALNNFTYLIKKQIGSMVSALDGIDLLVFTGTIGERSSYIREKICESMSVYGVSLDENSNKQVIAKNGYINKPGSEISIEVILTQESTDMAKRALELI